MATKPTEAKVNPEDSFDELVAGYLSGNPAKRGKQFVLHRASAAFIEQRQVAFFIQYFDEGDEEEAQALALVMPEEFARAVGKLLATVY